MFTQHTGRRSCMPLRWYTPVTRNNHMQKLYNKLS